VNAARSRHADVPALRALWEQAFGDGPALLDAFFSRLYRPEDAFVIREGGAVQSMAFQIPTALRFGGQSRRAAYLYAVATGRTARGHGCATALLEFAADELAARGYQLLLLVPGGAELREFYRARGFADFSTIELCELEPGPAPGRAAAVTPEDYFALRERLLAARGGAYVTCPTAALAFQEEIAKQGGGGLYRLWDGETEGCACVAREETGRALVYELLWPGETARGAALAAGAVGGKQALIRRPGGTSPFAMARWLDEAPPVPEPYFGLALD